MKTQITLLLALLIGFNASARTITAVKSSDWTDNNTWNPKSQPGDGDTIIIPAGIRVTLDKNKKFDGVVVEIYGTLELDNGKLKLDAASKVIIEASGQLKGSNANDQITIGNDLKYNGKGGTVYGYSFADYTTGIYPNGFALFSLPVHFTSFKATVAGSNVQLSWSTDREIENDHFDVERSLDGQQWTGIARIKGSGNSSTLQQYGYTDVNMNSAVAYYRILQVDANGKQTYSSVQMIRREANAVAAKIYVAGTNTINLDDINTQEVVSVRIFSQDGRQVSSSRINPQTTQSRIAIPGGRGMYVVQLSTSRGLLQVQKVIL